MDAQIKSTSILRPIMLGTVLGTNQADLTHSQKDMPIVREKGQGRVDMVETEIMEEPKLMKMRRLEKQSSFPKSLLKGKKKTV